MKYKRKIRGDKEIAHCLNQTNLKETLTKHHSLPHAFIPASQGFFKEQFYWDSFFIMQGLMVGDDKDQEIAKNMLENFFKMLDEYGYIPNSYDTYDTRSQPPFLSSMVLLIYKTFPDKKWLRKTYNKIKKEYSYWNKKPKKTLIGLRRYYDKEDHLDKDWDESYGSIQESGWDNTLRFGGEMSKCGKYVEGSVAHQVCPVDLNCLLYKVEKDLEKIAGILGKKKEEKQWNEKAKAMRKLINKYFWDEKTEFFYDYDYENKEKIYFKTLASFFPLWTKVATPKQAKLLRKNLKSLEHRHGLVTTEKKLGHSNIQWGYPNGWAPLHWIVIRGLKKYGFSKDANRITYKWLKICAKKYSQNKDWDEKICVCRHRKRADDGRYKNQAITNWTEGVFISLYDQLDK